MRAGGWTLGLVAAATLAAMGVLAAAGTAMAQSALAPAGTNPRMAILPVIVHSAESPDYLRAGLADMLTARVQQFGRFDVQRVDDAELGTTRLDQALETGRRLGVDYVLFGSFTRFGSGASLDMQCAYTGAGASRKDASLREIFVYSGSIGEVIPDLDELVGKVHRFAIPDFKATVDVAAAPPPTSVGGPDLDSLLNRVRQLEEAVRQLEVQQRGQ